ncbi:MAG: sulfotransferase domain-containing protein [Actinomycetota bacterium]
MSSSVHHAVRTLRENPRFRKVAIPAYRKLTSMLAFGKGPRVLINSLPKAGTHLLTSLLRHVPGMIHSGRHFVFDDFRTTMERPPLWGDVLEVDWQRLEVTLAALNKGQFMTAHCPAERELLMMLDKLDFKTLFIIRDPRDIVVSSAFYIARLERHIMHGRYKQLFSTDDERIMATITGFPADANGRGAESIGSKLVRYMEWLKAPRVHTCRFESLIGPAGGGDRDGQQSEVEGILRYLDRPNGPKDVGLLADHVWSQRSPTFRRGLIGDWRNHFSDEHKAAFKELAGEHLIALGYESDLDW